MTEHSPSSVLAWAFCDLIANLIVNVRNFMCILLRWTKGNGNTIYCWWQALGFTSKACDLIHVPEFAGTAARSPSADGAPNPSSGGPRGEADPEQGQPGLGAWRGCHGAARPQSCVFRKLSRCSQTLLSHPNVLMLSFFSCQLGLEQTKLQSNCAC